jgi:Protein of unknown function (DUF3592)
MDSINQRQRMIPEKPDFATLSLRDGWLLISWMMIVVMWAIALLNMAGFSVSRRHGGSVSANASDWPVMLGLAVVFTLVGIAIMARRMQFWKRAQTTTAIMQHIEPYRGDARNGYAIEYRYELDGKKYQGKATCGSKSPLNGVQLGDSFTVFFNPDKPQQSRVVV